MLVKITINYAKLLFSISFCSCYQYKRSGETVALPPIELEEGAWKKQEYTHDLYLSMPLKPEQQNIPVPGLYLLLLCVYTMYTLIASI